MNVSARVSTPAIKASLKGFEPSPEQWEAIAHPPIPVAIIAGAGAGKTAIMAARMIWMIESTMFRPSQILGLTFTNKAASELEDRVLNALAAMQDAPADQPTVSTYNAFADSLIREHGVRIGIDPDVGLLSQAQAWQLLLSEFENMPAFDAIESRSMTTVVRNALALADACANHMVTPERLIEEDERIVADADRFDHEIVATSRQRIELARVVRAYTDAKRKAKRIDYGDQVLNAVEILERFPEVVEAIRGHYPALLLDEYQDTNVGQRRMLQAMAPQGTNVTAVGDARQNIFQWRGSTLFNLIDFPKRHFLRAGGAAHDYLSLSTNYRSGSRILDVANEIIERVPAERRPGSPLAAHQPNGQGHVYTRLLTDQHAEAGFIGDEIARLHDDQEHPIPWNEFAILVRRRAHIGPIYDALRGRDIPVEVVGLSGLLQVPEIVDAIAWLRLIADPSPTGNRWLARILLGPRFRIHYRDLASLARWAAHHTSEISEGKRAEVEGAGEMPIVPAEDLFDPEEVAFSLDEALTHIDQIEDIPPEARRRLERARDQIASLRPLAMGSLLDLIQTVFSAAGIMEAVDSSAREDAPSARANITSFLGMVADFSPVAGDASLEAFLAYLDAAEDVEETLDLATPASSDSVKLMTVHQAKGLEFDVVFVPGVAAQLKDPGDEAKSKEPEFVRSIFPDTRISNPMTSYSQLPPGVREDAMHLPDPWTKDKNGAPIAKKKAAFARELHQRAVEDERRLFYVALTRARRLLYVTAAWWYERQQNYKGPSMFFIEVDRVAVTESLPHDELPETSPLQEALLEKSHWPPAAHSLSPDPLLGELYPDVVERLIDGSMTEGDVLSVLSNKDRTRAESLLGGHRDELVTLIKSSSKPAPGGIRTGSWSATQAIGLANGSIEPRVLQRPLPSKPSAARSIGTQVHLWIESNSRALSGLADEEALDEPSLPAEPARLARLRQTYSSMGFDDRTLAKLDSGEPMAELPFVLKLGGQLIRGRIDAVYETDAGGLEIVDFKTGAEVTIGEFDQLMVYAGALSKAGITSDKPVKLTYCYLATGTLDSREVSLAEAEEALSSLAGKIASAAP
ncbi:MAG: ATP-dependent helicase [Actinobacteria bacterium]|nr:ATP-dependent helicase [Actinomycetota bacterium]